MSDSLTDSMPEMPDGFHAVQRPLPLPCFGESEFQALYLDHFGVLQRYLRFALRDHYEAQDLAQTTLAHAYAALARGHSPTDPRAWLFTIAKNELLKHVQKQRRVAVTVEHELDWRRNAESWDEPPEVGWLSHSELALAFDGLSGREKQLLTLRFMFDLAAADIAPLLGYSSANSVKVTQNRVLKKLRSRLTPDGSGSKGVFGCSRLPRPAPQSRSAGISLPPVFSPRRAVWDGGLSRF